MCRTLKVAWHCDSSFQHSHQDLLETFRSHQQSPASSLQSSVSSHNKLQSSDFSYYKQTFDSKIEVIKNHYAPEGRRETRGRPNKALDMSREIFNFCLPPSLPFRLLHIFLVRSLVHLSSFALRDDLRFFVLIPRFFFLSLFTF